MLAAQDLALETNSSSLNAEALSADDLTSSLDQNEGFAFRLPNLGDDISAKIALQLEPSLTSDALAGPMPVLAPVAVGDQDDDGSPASGFGLAAASAWIDWTKDSQLASGYTLFEFTDTYSLSTWSSLTQSSKTTHIYIPNCFSGETTLYFYASNGTLSAGDEVVMAMKFDSGDMRVMPLGKVVSISEDASAIFVTGLDFGSARMALTTPEFDALYGEEIPDGFQAYQDWAKSLNASDGFLSDESFVSDGNIENHFQNAAEEFEFYGNPTWDRPWWNNVLIGNDEDETLVGNDYANDLTSGGGNDVLTGGGEADSFTLDGGTNRITDFSIEEGDSLFLDAEVYQGLGETGSNFEAGLDILVGESGLYLVNQADREVIGLLEGMSEADMADLAIGILTADARGILTSSEFSGFTWYGSEWVEAEAGGETITLTGKGWDIVIGSDEADQVTAAQGNDLVYGAGGDDEIKLGMGADTAYGGAGDDILIGGAGNDTLDGGLGDDVMQGGNAANSGNLADTFVFSGGTNRVLDFNAEEGDAIEVDFLNYLDSTYDAQGALAWTFSEEGAALVDVARDEVIGFLEGVGPEGLPESIEVAWYGADGMANSSTWSAGSDLADTILGNAKTDLLTGGLGDDNLKGLGGDDLLVGGDGKDKLNGGQGHDLLFGGAGSDILYGKDGDDILFSGGGMDWLYGSNGKDTFVLEGGYNFLLAFDLGEEILIRSEAYNDMTADDIMITPNWSNEYYEISNKATGEGIAMLEFGTSLDDDVTWNIGII